MKIAWKYIKKYRKRSIAIVLSIALSVFLIVGVGTLLDSAKASQVEQMKYELGMQHVVYKNINIEQIGKLRESEDIETLGISIAYDGWNYKNKVLMNILSADENYIRMYNSEVIKGRYPENFNEIAIEEWVLDNLGLSHDIGQTININLEIQEKEAQFKLVGILKDRPPTKMSNITQIFTAYNEDIISSDKINTYAYVEFKEGVNINKIINELANEIDIKDSEKNIWKNSMLLDVMGEYEAINWDGIRMAVLLMIISGVVIYSIFNISICQRIKDYGMMKAIGSTPKQVIAIIIAEILILSIIGIIIGSVVGVLGADILKEKIIPLFVEGKVKVTNIIFSKRSILMGILTTLISIMIAGLKAASISTKLSPIEAIAKSTEDRNIVYEEKKGILEKSLHIPKRVAYRNMMRNKRRFITIILSISIGCTFFMGYDYYIDLMSKDYENLNELYLWRSVDILGDVNNQTSMKEGFKKEHIEEMETPTGRRPEEMPSSSASATRPDCDD